MENESNFIKPFCLIDTQQGEFMDQAITLRTLLQQTPYLFRLIIAEQDCQVIRQLCRMLFERHLDNQESSVIFDGGLLIKPNRVADDLLQVLRHRAGLEDISLCVLDKQYLVQAKLAFEHMLIHPNLTKQLIHSLPRLPTTCDYFYATLSPEQLPVGFQIAKQGHFFWLIQPTAKSVTETFRALRQSGAIAQDVEHRIIVVEAKSAEQADDVYATLQSVVSGYLTHPLQYCGYVPKLKEGANCKRLYQNLSAVSEAMIHSQQLVVV